MKEKIGIEKLIELLNEYEGFKEDDFESWRIDEYGYLTEGGDYMRIGTNAKIISKQFGFIKWLVENDKIKDLEELDYIYGPELVNHQTEIIYTPYSLYNSLLMLLSISDTPIEDLISYLK